MPETRRPAEEDKACISSGNKQDDSPTDMDIQRKKLRQRWELASILNFFSVFEPVIQCQMEISAEDIETGLIVPNEFIAQLHTALLKGVAPSSKLLNVPDVWVSIMSKKLTIWWPWVAEGDIPLTAAKGEEMNKYKELDPAVRLYILKALCEIRADCEDIVIFVNENIKNGTGLSTFQKVKLGEDGKGTVYWYDGNENIGQRLYKEIQKLGRKSTVKGRVNPLGIVSQWETLATNFEELQKVVSEFSSSKVKLEVAVAKALQANVIPALGRLQKKKEALLKRQRRQEMLLTAFHNSATTRTGRTRKPVSYTYEEYDKAIKEAIEVTQHRKIAKDQRLEEEHRGCSKLGHSSDSGSIQSDHVSEKLYNADDEPEDVSNVDISDDVSNVDISDDVSNVDISDDVSNVEISDDVNSLNEEYNEVGNINRPKCSSQDLNSKSTCKHTASSHSVRLAGSVDMNISEGMSLTTKKRLRQRPTVNTAIESAIILDSEDENSSKDMNKRIKIAGNSSQAAADTDNDDFSS